MKYFRSNTLSLDESLCTGCRRCIEVCPHAVFRMNDKKAVITDKDSCMECGACMKNCAAGAVTVAIGTGCAYAIINGKKNGKVECGCSSSSSSCC